MAGDSCAGGSGTFAATLHSFAMIRARSAPARLWALLLTGALLAPVVGAGAVLADDLRDMAEGSTGLADNPETPGPDLYAPLAWGTDIPDMPSLIVLDAPHDFSVILAPLGVSQAPDAPRPAAASIPSACTVSVRGPPARA